MSMEWYYTTNKQQMGPVTWDELRELAESGILKPHDLVWSDGMNEWVKAVQQKGLFGSDRDGITAEKKSTIAKPPPGRRTRRADEEDDQDDEEDERERKRKARKRERESAETGIAVKVGLILAGVLGLFLVCGGCTAGIGWFSFRGAAAPARPAPQPAPAPNPAPVVQQPPGQPKIVHQDYFLNNLQPTPNGADHRNGNIRVFNFQQGRRVVITVTNQLQFNNTDVDLYVYRANENNPLIGDIRVPNEDRNCRIEFVVPQTGQYRVRIVNIGPGIARSCHVRIEEH